MLKVDKRESGSRITYYISGSNGEVCVEIAKLIDYYVNGGYGGELKKFEFDYDEGEYKAVFTRYDNCD